MIHRVDARLREEAERYHLLFACPDCAYFEPGAPDEPRDPPRCALGFPIAPHLSPRLADRDQVIFCKAFELG
ncbi:hypothetical protein [Chondromyces apiculatus]|uniref:Uncharacterized protein n=1 Tax=Chondromyces apiculatus DSM 436 TaxID=1192034 RepID=A0A017T756_9BACT|nr:hypothetical protein [Chondromyces apiculatus]EYF04431.1 Hypothetical protein CAP_4570 [Chondromyces apiculatus DSM 436]